MTALLATLLHIRRDERRRVLLQHTIELIQELVGQLDHHTIRRHRPETLAFGGGSLLPFRPLLPHTLSHDAPPETSANTDGA